jgi:putative transposase
VRLCEDATRWVERVRVGEVKFTSATVTREADRWFCSLAVEVGWRIPAHNGHTDGGSGSTWGCWPGPPSPTGQWGRAQGVAAGPAQAAPALPCPQPQADGSRNRAARRLARHHAKVAAIRRDHLHKLTTRLAKNHGRIVVEDLNVNSMLRNRRLARALADAGFSQFRQQLSHKCQWYGAELVVAERWFPSSKQGSGCGAVMAELRLRERTYRCDACGLSLDRELNVAINLAGWVHPEVASSAGDTLNGCREDTRPGSGPADLVEAATGTFPGPTGSTGGPHLPDAFVTG